MKLDIGYFNDGLDNYLVIRPEDARSISEYQLSLLKSGKFSFLLPAELRRQDGGSCLYYRISSRLSLTEMLEKREKPGSDELISILGGIKDVVLNQRQQLKADCFLLDPEYIFYKRDSLLPGFVYVPVKEFQGNFVRQLKALVSRLAALTAEDKACGDILNGILTGMDEEGFGMPARNNIFDWRRTAGKAVAPVSSFLFILRRPWKKYAKSLNRNGAKLVSDEKGIRKEIAIDADRRFIVGRNGRLSLSLPEKTVSGLHAEIIRQDGGYFVLDLNSTNGTYVNGIKIPGGRKRKLDNGDTVRFSNVEFTFLR